MSARRRTWPHEQARGHLLDRRCDIWAFGCILFEAVTDKQAFDRKTAPDILAAVIEGTPAWEALPADVPPRIGDLVRRCLRKDPRQRMRDADDVRLEIEEALVELARGPSAHRPSLARWRGWLWGPVLAVAVALAAFALGRWWSVAGGALMADRVAGEAPAAAGRSGQLLLGGTMHTYKPRVSPDGRWLAFIVTTRDWRGRRDEARFRRVVGAHARSPTRSREQRALVAGLQPSVL